MQERTISLCKDTLKIFDKDYLLRKKETKVEDIFCASEINDIDFDLLVQCMSPAVLTKGKAKRSMCVAFKISFDDHLFFIVVRNQAVVDENSNDCTNKENVKYSKTVMENVSNILQIFQSCMKKVTHLFSRS